MGYSQLWGRSEGGKVYGIPPASGHRPKTQVRGWQAQLPGQEGLGGEQCQPGAQAAGRRLGAYLGFELFQKTVWRSAVARLQHRPKSGAQRNSIAQGLARPGEDAGGSSGSGFPRAVSAAHSAPRTALAPPPGDSAFWASTAHHPPRPWPRPAPPRPERGGPRAWGLGGGGGEGRGAERDLSVCRDGGALHRAFARLWVCMRPRGPVRGAGSASPGSVACGRRERAARAGLRTRRAGPGCAVPRASLAGCKVVDRARTFPEPSTPRLGPRVPTLLPPAFPGLRSAAPPHTRGCLFLLGLSMLSLFGRLCHRLDAGNKVRPCVIKCVTCAAGAKGACAHH